MSQVSQKRLFVSYSHRDKAEVRLVVDILEAGGHAPWFDENLTGGRSWRDQLLVEIQRSHGLVYMLSPDSLNSKHCRWEFSQAIKHGKPVIPVLLKPVDRLPQSLLDIQYIDFTGREMDRRRATAMLMRSILYSDERIIPATDAPEAVPPEEPPIEYTTGKNPAVKSSNTLESTTDEWGVIHAPLRQRLMSAMPLLIVLALVVIVILALLNFIRNPGVFDGFETPANSTPQGTLTPDFITVATQVNANLRGGPGTNYPVIGSVASGQPLLVIARSAGQEEWYLVTTSNDQQQKSLRGWILASLTSPIVGDTGRVPTALTRPAPPVSAPPTQAQGNIVCNRDEWFSACESNGCGAEYISKCNSDGTGFVCVWDPTRCRADSVAPVFPPRAPVVPTSLPGNSTAVPFVCTQSWLESELQKYASSLVPPISVAQLKQQLILQGYDRNGNGQIDCDDYRALTGTG